jgi:hypothetical protein
LQAANSKVNTEEFAGCGSEMVKRRVKLEIDTVIAIAMYCIKHCFYKDQEMVFISESVAD